MHNELEVWNRLKGEVNKTKNSGKTKLEIKKKPAKKPRKKNKQTGSSPEFPTDAEFEEVLGYRDVMKVPEFQQIGVDNRETETNRNDESPENMRIMRKFSSYFVSKFLCANVSSCVSFFSPCLIQ